MASDGGSDSLVDHPRGFCMVSPDESMTWLKIPKNASSSLNVLLNKQGWTARNGFKMPFSYVKSKDTFSFAVWRSPTMRWASAVVQKFRMMFDLQKRVEEHPSVVGHPEFPNFLECCIDLIEYPIDSHFKPQVDFLVPEIPVDEIVGIMDLDRFLKRHSLGELESENVTPMEDLYEILRQAPLKRIRDFYLQDHEIYVSLAR